jgi:lambda repressor-like predicted transcriptional regulator
MVSENDQTQDMARPAIILAAIRSGGTFLAHCLSNHPLIFCDRGEALHNRSVWCRTLHPDRRKLLAALWNQTGYQVSACKLTYAHAFKKGSGLWEQIVRRQPRVIWLRRENAIRQAVSVLINTESRRGQLKRAQHTFARSCPVKVTFAPEQILKVARSLRQHDQQARKRLQRIKWMYRATYAQVVGEESQAAEWLPTWTGRKLCAFLEVPYERMGCALQRVNPYPLREMLSNWRAVEAAIRGSEFSGLLADERAWM